MTRADRIRELCNTDRGIAVFINAIYEAVDDGIFCEFYGRPCETICHEPTCVTCILNRITEEE